MNNLVIYNEAEINSVEICVLPPLFKVKVVMDSDTDATVTITDINGAEDFASVCIEPEGAFRCTVHRQGKAVYRSGGGTLYCGRHRPVCGTWHCAL